MCCIILCKQHWLWNHSLPSVKHAESSLNKVTTGNEMKISVQYGYTALVVAMLAGCTGTATQTVNYPATPATPTASSPPKVVVATPVVTPAPPPVVVQQAPADNANERTLANAVSAYDRGDFGAAIRLLIPVTNDGSLDSAQQTRALKTLAFSQCSTGATVACRQSFERAFRADSGFDLSTAERGHPIWGPQFERARKAVLGR
jgi:hypothetical protein